MTGLCDTWRKQQPLQVCVHYDTCIHTLYNAIFCACELRFHESGYMYLCCLLTCLRASDGMNRLLDPERLASLHQLQVFIPFILYLALIAHRLLFASVSHAA